jgi:hypothetical protein
VLALLWSEKAQAGTGGDSANSFARTRGGNIAMRDLATTPLGKLMPSRSNKLAIWGGIALLTICALSINIALPMTVRVVDDKTGQPIEGAFVVSYLAIRHLPHNFDDGKSVIQEAVTDVNGDAKLKLSVSWILVNGFQDYNSRLLTYKPGYAPNAVLNPFNIIKVFASYATIATSEIRLTHFANDASSRQDQMGSFASQISTVCTKKSYCKSDYLPRFLSAFEPEYTK